MKYFTFLLEYNNYIDNIINKDKNDDVYIFNNLKNQKIVEGLIHTYPVNKTINIINRRFPELKCVSGLSGNNEIYIEGEFQKLNNYLPLFNNLGFFVSRLTIDGEKWIKDFNDDIKPLSLFLEPKYDVRIDPLPKILYHSSLIKFEKKINRIGLIPKSCDKISKHPDRIYFTDDFKTAKVFGLYIKKEYKEDYLIYEINTEDLNINLYTDVNMDDAYYTLNNIPPNFIKRIE